MMGEVGDPNMLETTAEPVPAKKLTEEERLTIENKYLHIQNLALQVERIDAQKAAAAEQIKELQKELTEYTAALSKKYGVDLTRTTVAANGTIHGARLPRIG